MIYLKFLISFLLPLTAIAQNYQIGDTVNVVAINGLILRAEPTSDSEKKSIMTSGEKVQILEKQAHDTIFGFEGNWIFVQTLSHDTGYVFDAFVSTLPIATEPSIPPDKKHGFDPIYGGLQEALRNYALQNFESHCSVTYGNSSDGEGSFEMKIYDLKGGHKMIEHQ